MDQGENLYNFRLKNWFYSEEIRINICARQLITSNNTQNRNETFVIFGKKITFSNYQFHIENELIFDRIIISKTTCVCSVDPFCKSNFSYSLIEQKTICLAI